MKFRKYDTSKEWNPNKIDMMQLYNARADEAEKLEKELEKDGLDAETVEAVKASLHSITVEAEKIASMLESWDEPAAKPEGGARAFNPLATMEMRSRNFNIGGISNMENNNNNNAEIRSFQRFLSVGIKGMSAEEQRSLNTSGAAAVLPVEIYNELITDSKYSDLLQRAKVFNEQGAGKLYIPIASANSAAWHTELAAGTEASPTLTKIELGGYELMRLMTMSAAAESMTEAGFKSAMLQLLGAELVETLEYSFINGTGSGQPKGLSALTWITSGSGQNAIVTAETSTSGTFNEISFKDIAKGLSLLRQKYARGAILLMNADTAYNTISAADDSAGAPIFNLGEVAKSVLGHEIVISEHVAADTVYIVDPRELYVRFSMPVQIEADRSSGFTSASVNMRALCVVDAAWNPAACVRITKGAAA